MNDQSSFVRLAKINVNDKIEKKGGLSYLSWAWAWDQLLRADPDAAFEYGEPKMYGQTMMVYCTVTAFGKPRTAHLPVMDHRNKPIPDPDAFQVNTAMQRALVKAIALHGLGLYIYAGEDLPAPHEEQPCFSQRAGWTPITARTGIFQPPQLRFIERIDRTRREAISAKYSEFFQMSARSAELTTQTASRAIKSLEKNRRAA